MCILQNDSTPLIIASSCGHLQAVQLLLEHGAKSTMNHVPKKVFSLAATF